MGEEMRGIGGFRRIAALNLVLALRACFDTLEPVLDREIDRPVIAKLEMEERKFLAAAPVAAIERVPSRQVQRAGDRHTVLFRQHQHDALTEPLAQ